MTDEEVIKTRDDLEMMKRSNLWPHTFLPLINRRDKSDSPLGADGLLFYQGWEEYYFLRNQNMFMPIPPDAKFEKGSVAMLKQLVTEGWQVD